MELKSITTKEEKKIKKYSFTGETKMAFGVTLHRIKAEVNFGYVVAGELGGYIEKENNLSHDGNAWVYGNARVCGNAEVYGNAEVSGDARVYDNARVCGDAWVSGDARVCGDAWVSGDARVLWISKIGSRNGTTTFFKSKLGIKVSCGCFLGTIEEFEKRVQETHGDNEHGKAYRLAIEIAKLRMGQALAKGTQNDKRKGIENSTGDARPAPHE